VADVYQTAFKSIHGRRHVVMTTVQVQEVVGVYVEVHLVLLDFVGKVRRVKNDKIRTNYRLLTTDCTEL